MSILDVLRSDGYITVNKVLARMIGLHEAIILAELISWYRYAESKDALDNEGMFYCTVDTLEEQTTLSKHLQSVALKNLKKYGIVDFKQKGLPARRYFSINEKALTELIVDKKLKILTTDEIKCSEPQKTEKPHGYQKLKKLTTGGENLEQQEVHNFASNIELDIKNNILKEIDRLIDADALKFYLISISEKLEQEHIEIINRTYQLQKDKEGFSMDMFIEKVEKTVNAKIKSNFFLYLNKSVTGEIIQIIANQAQAKSESSKKQYQASQNAPVRSRNSKRNQLPLVQSVPSQMPSEEARAQARARAAALDENKTVVAANGELIQEEERPF